MVAVVEARAATGALDLYGGVTLHQPAEVSVSETTGSGTTAATGSIDLSRTGEIGLRLQGWLPHHEWFGLALDVGYFQARGSGVDIDAYPFSMSMLLRAPLFASPGRPAGWLQPHAMAGVSFYLVDINGVDLEGMGGSAFELGWPLPGAPEYVVGPYAAAGLTLQLSASLGLFGECRYSAFDVGFDTTNSMILPTMNGRVDVSVSSAHAVIGVSHPIGGRTVPSPER